jgi:putative ABC transport system permease protein
MMTIIQDIRYAIRAFGKSPAFFLTTIATLALGIGASTSIFSVVNGIVLRPLPFPDSDRLVAVYSTEVAGERDNHSGANFLDLKSQSESFEDIAGYVGMRFNVVGSDGAQLIRGTSVTSNFFSVLGVGAALGRTLSPDVEVPGADRAVVLSHGLWQSRFGGDVAVLGQRMKMNEEQYAVVGVMPPGFRFPDNAEFWAASRYRVPESPVEFEIDPEEARSVSWFQALGRLDDGMSLAQAQVEVTMIGNRLAEEYPDANLGESFLIVPLRESIVGELRSTLYVLLGAVGFLLLIACANVANLLLVRASGREREIAMRTALGAGRLRILRQLVTESLVLALAGGVTGFLIAQWGTKALLALAPDGIPRVAEVATDWRVLGFTLAVALGTGLVFGLVPALQSLVGTRESAVLAGSRQTASRARNRLRSALIVGEVAVSLWLLVGAGLMGRTLLALTRVDPGFNANNTLSARVWIPASRYQEDHQVQAFYRETMERVRAIPGVQSAGAVLSLPVNAGINGTFAFSIEGLVVEEGEQGPLAGYQIATPDYFRTMGIPLIRGRLFQETDDAEAPSVAVINEALAETYWRGEDPIGKRITWDDPEDDEVDWVTIVGLVGDTRHNGLDEAPRTETYRPYLQSSLPYMTLVIRSDLDVGTLTTAVRTAVTEIDPEQPISAVQTMEQVVFDSLGSRRFNMFLLAVFAAAALVLAAVGLYGVLSFSVAQRANEIGIRMALGARTTKVIRQVIREGFWMAAIGVAIGTAGALALTRLMSSMIHGVSATDPTTFILGIVLLTAIALLASTIPALRASRVDPVEALRAE